MAKTSVHRTKGQPTVIVNNHSPEQESYYAALNREREVKACQEREARIARQDRKRRWNNFWPNLIIWPVATLIGIVLFTALCRLIYFIGKWTTE